MVDATKRRVRGAGRFLIGLIAGAALGAVAVLLWTQLALPRHHARVVTQDCRGACDEVRL
jgi:hypothetical protein